MSALKKTTPQKPVVETPRKPSGNCATSSASKHNCSTGTQCAAETPAKQKSTNPTKTRIVAHIDCGYTNNLFIRGEGASTLSWDKGIQMKNVGSGEWVWESDRPFSTVQFKVLVNDSWYEQGNNHTLAFGQEMNFTPQF